MHLPVYIRTLNESHGQLEHFWHEVYLHLTVSADLQEGNLQPTTMTKAEAANQNNCYLVYFSLANSGQMIMPAALMTGGNNAVRMLSQFPTHHESNGRLPGVANLPVRISPSVIPLPVSSICNSQTDLMTGQSQDKSKPRVAVVVPYSDSCANNYRPDGPRVTGKFEKFKEVCQTVDPFPSVVH